MANDDARRQRTRRLIEFGGLVERSNIGNFLHTQGGLDIDTPALLGALLEQVERLSRDPDILYRWRELGKASFSRR